MATQETICRECGGQAIYGHRYVEAGTLRGPKLLPDLGGLGEHRTFTVFVCADCGFTRFFADEAARGRSRPAGSG